MDPLCHTLVGATLAETRLGSRSRLAMPILLVAANLPDVDVAAYLFGSDSALGFRRGWTHGILAAVLFPLLLTAAALAFERWRRTRRRSIGSLSPRTVLLLAVVGVWSHPLLDWLNVYGIRLLMPFDQRWFYGDALFIIDPWVWLGLGGVVCLARIGRRPATASWGVLAALVALAVAKGTPPPYRGASQVWMALLVVLVLVRAIAPRHWPAIPGRRLAEGALVALVLYAAAMWGLRGVAERQALAALAEAGVTGVSRVMAAPVPLSPWHRQIIAALPDGYVEAELRWFPTTVRIRRQIPLGPPDELVTVARRSPEVEGFRRWARFPYEEVDRSPSGATVYLIDARYASGRTRGFGGAVVNLTSP